MRVRLPFHLPASKADREALLARLNEVVELINMDREEEAIAPDEFTGNLKDYPEWLREAFTQREEIATLEAFCKLEPGELADWDLEWWYDDFCGCESWNFAVQPLDGERAVLVFEVANEHYGGDLSAAWLLLAAGAAGLEEAVVGE